MGHAPSECRSSSEGTHHCKPLRFIQEGHHYTCVELSKSAINSNTAFVQTKNFFGGILISRLAGLEAHRMLCWDPNYWRLLDLVLFITPSSTIGFHGAILAGRVTRLGILQAD